jgi:hypothetical protein
LPEDGSKSGFRNVVFLKEVHTIGKVQERRDCVSECNVCAVIHRLAVQQDVYSNFQNSSLMKTTASCMCQRLPYDRYLLYQSCEFFSQNPRRLFLKLVSFGARYVPPLFSNQRFDITKHFHYFSLQTQEN